MGALTLKVFSNEVRDWELIDHESFDPTSSFGVSLKLSLRGNKICQVEPNDSKYPWITDKARLFFDGMFVKDEINKTKKVWNSFFLDLFDLMYFTDHLNFQKKKIFFIIFLFENINIEVLNLLYLMSQKISSLKLRRLNFFYGENDFEINYQLSTSVQPHYLAKSTLAILLNTDLRYEGYLLNLKLRQRFFKGNFKTFSVGSLLNLTFPTVNLGSNFNTLKILSEGVHLVCQEFKTSCFPILITNTEFFKRKDSKSIFEVFKKTIFNCLNVLNHNLSSAGINTVLNFLPLSESDFCTYYSLYFVNAPIKSSSNFKNFVELFLLNSLSKSKKKNQNKLFIDQNANYNQNNFFTKIKKKFCSNYYDLPCNLFLEDSETFIDTQGIFKRSTKIISLKPPSKSSWQILRKIFVKTNSVFFYNQKKDYNIVNFDVTNSTNFKNYSAFLFYATQMFTNLSFYLTKQNLPYFDSKILNSIKKTKTKIRLTKLKSWLDDFFSENGKNSFSQNSLILNNCSKNLRKNLTNFF